MTTEDINNRLKQIKTEDYIWIVYLGIIFYSIYSNKLEKNYYTKHDLIAKKKYRQANQIIFTILLIVYLYFLKNSISDLSKLKESDSNKKKQLTYLSFYASLLITISGIIFLYIAFTDDNLDIELAFN